MKSKLDNKYKTLDFFDIQLADFNTPERKAEIKQLKDEFLAEENLCGSYLYLDMKSLILDDSHAWQLELYDRFDYDFTYSIDILDKWTGSHSGNNLWYCLQHKWNGYQDCFDFTAIQQHDQEEILQLCKKINLKDYRNSKFNKDLLADISSEMVSFVFPRLRDLTYYNTLGLPKSLSFLISILFLTIISGVLAPLILTSIKTDFNLLLASSSIAVCLLCLSIFYFLLKFKKILSDEIKIG